MVGLSNMLSLLTVAKIQGNAFASTFALGKLGGINSFESFAHLQGSNTAALSYLSKVSQGMKHLDSQCAGTQRS
jgi:hypothetical protein